MPRVHTVLRVVFSVLLAAILGLGSKLRLSAGGCTWVAFGLEGGTIRALAIDPQSPSTLYAGTIGGGVFQSRDAGATWSAVNAGLTNTDIRALAIDPHTPSTLYAGTWGGGVFVLRCPRYLIYLPLVLRNH